MYKNFPSISTDVMHYLTDPRVQKESVPDAEIFADIYEPLYVKSEYLLHEGFPLVGCDCDSIISLTEEMTGIPSCCDKILITVYYPTKNRYSIGKFYNIRNMQGAIYYPVFGTGEPYNFYMRIEFDTGPGADTYKAGSWYHYRVAPQDVPEILARERKMLHDLYVEGLETCDLNSLDFGVLPLGLAVSLDAGWGAALYWDSNRGWSVASGEGKVLYFYMRKDKYYRKSKKNPEQDRDEWNDWKPAKKYRLGSGSAVWRVILLLKDKVTTNAPGFERAWTEYTRRLSALVRDPVVSYGLLRSLRWRA